MPTSGFVESRRLGIVQATEAMPSSFAALQIFLHRGSTEKRCSSTLCPGSPGAARIESLSLLKGKTLS